MHPSCIRRLTEGTTVTDQNICAQLMSRFSELYRNPALNWWTVKKHFGHIKPTDWPEFVWSLASFKLQLSHNGLKYQSDTNNSKRNNHREN